MTPTKNPTPSGRSTRQPRARARDPITDEQRARVLALHADGLGRNAIATQSGVSRGSVSSIVTAAGLSFDRTATAAATEARAVDQRAARVQIAADVLGDAQRVRLLLLEQLAQGETRGALDAAKAVGLLLAAHVRLDQLNPDTELDEARGIMGDFAEGIRLVYSELADAPAADTADGAA